MADRFRESRWGEGKRAAKTKVVVKGLTGIVARPETYYGLMKKGGRIEVGQRSDLLAVCVNPVSPDGYKLDPETLYASMEDALGIPVYDVRRMER